METDRSWATSGPAVSGPQRIAAVTRGLSQQPPEQDVAALGGRVISVDEYEVIA
jgi:hypothetical protein